MLMLSELRVKDELDYLDKVKIKFGASSQIYIDFVNIMKNYKSRQIDTFGVIRQVSTLFHGNEQLMLGFNIFLPKGFSIESLKVGRGYAAVYRAPGQDKITKILCSHLNTQVQSNHSSSNRHHQNSIGGPSEMIQQHATSQLSELHGFVPLPPSPVKVSHMSHSQHHQMSTTNNVTIMKKRFSSHPHIYKSFLEILHTYQKEQRGIKEVLHEVSTLFADHPDLLREFTYFLADAAQAQAKAQLAEIAKEAEERKRLKMSKARGHQTSSSLSSSSMKAQQARTANSQYSSSGSPTRSMSKWTETSNHIVPIAPSLPFGMKRKRYVENSLKYIDGVKVECGDRPQIKQKISRHHKHL